MYAVYKVGILRRERCFMTTLNNLHDASTPWTSAAIPAWTRASAGALTPRGSPAVFTSSAHAWFGLRLVYLAEVADVPRVLIMETEERYRRAWERFVRHGDEMQRLAAVIDQDLDAAVALWNEINQAEVDAAFSTAMCEREPLPRVNVATLAMRHFGLEPTPSVSTEARDRKVSKSDNETAWRSSPGGLCKSCSTPTISQRQHDRIGKILRDHTDMFDLTPTFMQTNGKEAPLWSKRILIAAKGVADHIVPRAHGGKISPDNIANVCAACNYSRGNVSLDLMRVAAYA